MNAWERGAFGPHMRSAKSGASTFAKGGSGGKGASPEASLPTLPGHPQAFTFTWQVEAPWFPELQVRCPLVTTPQRWAPLGQEDPLTLQLPC